MTQTETPVPPVPLVRRPMRYLLIGSLALNLLVLGIIGGAVIRGPGGFGGPRGVDLALGPIVEALAPDDRQAIRTQLRANDMLRQHPRQDREALVVALQVALRAETYDPAAIEEALSLQRDRLVAVQTAGQQALVARITLMSPEARLAFADRLQVAIGRGHDDTGVAPGN